MAAAKNTSVKRIMREYKEFKKDPSPDFIAAPLEDNMFEWHFTIRGPSDSPYEGGRYHGRILLPSQYPFKPPDIILLTPSGRFQTHKKICLSISSYHPKNWQPSWSIRTVLIALMAFFPTKPNGAIGSLDWTDAEKRACARKSGQWKCEECGQTNLELLPGQGSSSKVCRKIKSNETAVAPVAAEGVVREDKQACASTRGGSERNEDVSCVVAAAGAAEAEADSVVEAVQAEAELAEVGRGNGDGEDGGEQGAAEADVAEVNGGGGDSDAQAAVGEVPAEVPAGEGEVDEDRVAEADASQGGEAAEPELSPEAAEKIRELQRKDRLLSVMTVVIAICIGLILCRKLVRRLDTQLDFT